MEDQQNNNQSGSGISGFGSSDNTTNIPIPAPQPAETSSIIQGFPETKPAESAPVSSAPQSNTSIANDMPTGFESKPNFTKQTIVGGVDEPQAKSKPMFSMPSKMTGTTEVQPAPQSEDIPPVTPSYNEITASGSKNKFALIAIIIGALLLVLAGAGYYYLTVLNAPEPVTEPEPMVEQPATQEVVEDMTIDQDQYILNLNQLEATSSAEPSEIRRQLENLDFQNIDSEIITGTDQTQQAPIDVPPESAIPQ